MGEIGRRGEALQNEGSRREHRDADDAHDPVDVRPRRPGEQEQARGQQDDGEEGGHEAVLLSAQAVRLDVGLEVEPDVGAVDDDADDGADDDAGEDDALLAEVEAVVADIDEWEGLEVRVVDAVDERGVQVSEEHGRVLDADLHRDQQRVVHHFADRLLPLVDFGL